MEHRGEYDSVDSVYFAQRRLERAIEALQGTQNIYIRPDVAFENCGWRFDYGDRRLIDCNLLELKTVVKLLFQKVQELQAELDKKQAQPVQIGFSSPALELLR